MGTKATPSLQSHKVLQLLLPAAAYCWKPAGGRTRRHPLSALHPQGKMPSKGRKSSLARQQTRHAAGSTWVPCLLCMRRRKPQPMASAAPTKPPGSCHATATKLPGPQQPLRPGGFTAQGEKKDCVQQTQQFMWNDCCTTCRHKYALNNPGQASALSSCDLHL